MTIRTRVTAALLTLITMALLETVIVIVQYRAVRDAFDEQSRTAAIRVAVEEIGRSLVSMQSAQRGYAFIGDQQELAGFEAQAERFQRQLEEVRPRFVDAAQQSTFDAIVTRATQWQDTARSIMRDAGTGRDVSARIATEAAPLFRILDDDLGAFARERVTRSDAAAAAFREQLRVATLTLTAVPLVAIFVLAAVLIVTDRRILVPLKGLAAAAGRLADGDYTPQLPDERPDEVGALIGAFRRMRDAVQDRAAAAANATNQLRVAHGELLATIDLVPSAIIIMNADGSVRLQNRAARAVLGEPPQDAAARKSYWQQFTVRDAIGRQVRIRDIAPVRALAGIETIAEELELQRPDGARVVILVGAVPLRDDHGRVAGVVAAFQDITRLRELDRLKDEFVSIVSHELRTPLAAIRGSLQLVIHDRTSTDAPREPEDESGELLAVALKSCDRLVRIVNDMLDLSKIEAGKIDLKLAPVPPAAAIGQAVDGVQNLADAAGVAIVREVAADVPDVRADSDRLTQALINLISNAIKFSPRGTSVTVSARLVEREMVRFSVADRGPGIAAGDVARLFQRFQQLDSTATRKAGGTGLGLAITKGIVSEHGGEISVESHVGAGSTFTFTIPVAGARPGAAPVTAARQAGAAPCILVVEDDAEARIVMRRGLERHGFSVIEAADGREAIDAATRQAPDLIVLDLHLPAVHGRDVIRVLRKHSATAGVPIVAVSGRAEERQTLESLVLGANVFVSKPADLDAVVADIRRLLDRTVPGPR